MRLIDKFSYSQNWNIGFCRMTPTDLCCYKTIKRIKWLKHPYQDRWFADPFILKVTEEEIVVFVEECMISHPKGIISELVISKKNMQLLRKYELLQLDTHLSYPIIYRHNNKIYVCPENSASGCLTLYEYDTEIHKLVNPRVILNEPVVDATIIQQDNIFYLVATKNPESQSNLFLYSSQNFFGPYTQVDDAPVVVGLENSRPGGNFFRLNGDLYRPAQNCHKRYGASLSVMKALITPHCYEEEFMFGIYPKSFKYNLGLHTINLEDAYAVVDGYGYSYPIIGRAISFLRQLKHSIG